MRTALSWKKEYAVYPWSWDRWAGVVAQRNPPWRAGDTACSPWTECRTGWLAPLQRGNEAAHPTEQLAADRKTSIPRPGDPSVCH